MKPTSFIISDEEYRQRWKNVQRIMAREGRDLLLVYGDDHSFSGPANIRYLCDYAPHFEPAVIVMPGEGEPALVTGPELKEYALLQSSIKEIVAVHEFGLPGQEYPFADLTDLRHAISTVFTSGVDKIKRIGIAGMDLMSYRIMSVLMEQFRDADIVDAGPWLTEIRMVKSESEIMTIRRAYELADAGLQACIHRIAEGVTEHEVAAEGEYAMRLLGAEGTGMDTVIGSGPNARPIITRTTDRSIHMDELVAISIGPRFQGYHGQLGRPVYLGRRIPKKLDHAMKAAKEAQELTREVLKPGAIGEEVEAVGRNHIEKSGLLDYYVYSSCHSVGTAEAEEPVLGPGSRLVVQPDMVFSIDIPLFLAPFGGFRIEDGFLVTAEGAVKLNRTS
jgi:Xaa-Pro aminopeptidase